ncbi:MAG: isoleucine--tRNA ligase [Candidatus Pacearchaeota archaeon]
MAERKTIDEQEKEVLVFWNKDKTFEKSLEKTKKGKPYTFYDGPPFATGLPHYGHILVSVIKDVFPRFFTMNGMYVKRVWGWDCHGLPVESIAERELGINSKDEIEKMGVKKFNDFCRSKVLTYVEDWKEYINRIGRWVDFEKGYKTMDTKYIESVWWAFKELYDKGYLYEGEKILMYCPHCATPLAKSEIAMDNSYKNVKDISVVVKFKVKNLDKTFALSWTTTPWTLPSNLALAVNPLLEYAFVKDKSDGNTYILSKALLKNFYKSEEEYEVLKSVKGRELEGMEYEPLYPYFKGMPNSFRVILGDFVSEEDGTGIVHTAPAFGEDDNVVCRKYSIPSVQPVDGNGRFTSEVADYEGEYVHEVNEKIVADLKKEGKVVLSRKIEHEYPFCYRCDTKLIYRALPAWFVNIQKIKKKLLEVNSKISWFPEFLKEGRMRNNIEMAPDWNITRNRYWASAIPIWKSDSGKIKVIGSIDELKKYAKSLKGEIDLHKDYLDEVVLKIGGEEYKRIPEVLDCWFESGSMSFAQFHYPFENKDYFDKNFPAQFITEYIGQTRAWFYYMMALSAILFGKKPFENVLVTGTILAEDGQKMSKSKRNYQDPFKIVEKYGADSLRFYLLSSPVMSAENINFSEKSLEEIYKKVLVLLYNVSNFYSLYPEIKVKKVIDSKNVLDLWVISRMNELICDVKNSLNGYDTVSATNLMRVFIDDLSTWYVRRSRDRFNEGDSDAKTTLNYVLNNLSKVCASIIPFVSEVIYRSLGNKESVHLQNWPDFDKKKMNKNLKDKMNLTREVVSLALKERDVAKVSLKQPLSKLEVTGVELSEEFLDIIKEEVNVKRVKLKKGKGLFVKLDFIITPELEAEGFVREISRNIQASRKKVNLVKEDLIDLFVEVEDDSVLRGYEGFLKERVGAKKIFFGRSDENLDFTEDGKVKGKKFWFGFRKV